MLFKSFSLIVDESYPDTALLNRMANDRVRRINIGEFSYKFCLQFVDERFFLMAVDYSDGKYSDTVYDTESESEKENPKKRYEIEYKDQFFACYDVEKCELYISNIQRKSAVRALFADYILPELKVRVRERLSSLDDFAAVVRSIKRVKYTQTKNLVNLHPDSLFAQRYDPLGLDLPDKLTSTLEFDTGLHARPIIDKLRDMISRHNSREIESLEVTGEDADGFDQLFSLDKIVKSIVVEVDADADGRYDSDEIFEKLMIALRR